MTGDPPCPQGVRGRADDVFGFCVPCAMIEQGRSVIMASWCTTIIVPTYDGQLLVNTGTMWKRCDYMEGGTMFKGCPLRGSVQDKDAGSALGRDTCRDNWRSLRLKHSL
jgi:hypothetical protein